MTNKNKLEIVETDSSEITTAESSSNNMMQFAIKQGASIDQMKELMAMQERMDANNAKRAYNAAMAAFTADAPIITKDGHAEFGSTRYNHATLGNVVSTISSALSKHGLSHRWKTEQIDGGVIKVTCILTHSMGHSEETTLQSSPDASGGKNNIQAIGSAVSYLQRYTLLSATGCATEDDDGIKAEDRINITEAQAEIIDNLLSKVENSEGFYRFYNVTDANQLQQRDYQEAVKMLEAKIRLKAKK